MLYKFIIQYQVRFSAASRRLPDASTGGSSGAPIDEVNARWLKIGLQRLTSLRDAQVPIGASAILAKAIDAHFTILRGLLTAQSWGHPTKCHIGHFTLALLW